MWEAVVVVVVVEVEVENGLIGLLQIRTDGADGVLVLILAREEQEIEKQISVSKIKEQVLVSKSGKECYQIVTRSSGGTHNESPGFKPYAS